MNTHILPFYVVCDESYSMLDHMDKLNAGLRELYRTVSTDPRLAGSVRFCLIGFADMPKIRVPLSPPSDLAEATCQAPRAETNFGAVFALLRRLIEIDMAALSEEAHLIYQPVVFFLSDGQPTDRPDWSRAFDRLLDQNWPERPRVFSFGIGDADAAIISKIGSDKAFMASSGTSPGVAAGEFASLLTSYVVTCAQHAYRLPATTPTPALQPSAFVTV